MTIFNFPSISPSAITWGLISNTGKFVSPLTGYTQTIQRKGTRWMMTAQFNNLDGDDLADLRAFLYKLNGAAHRFRFSDPSHTQRGVLTGSPLINGAGQAGYSLITDGWTISQSPIIKAGDRFEVSDQLFECTADANSDGSGNATISVIPEIHADPGDGSALDVSSPTGKFMLLDQSIAWAPILAGFASVGFSAIEDIA